MSGQVKENLVAVFNRLGGTAAMADWAAENLTEFYKLYAKMLPRQLDAEIKHTLVDDLSERLMTAKQNAETSRKSLN